MLKELYNNRSNIINNWINIIYKNRLWLIMVISLGLLLLIYALISIIQYKISLKYKYINLKKQKNLKLKKEAYSNYERDKNQKTDSRNNFINLNNKNNIEIIKIITKDTIIEYNNLLSYINREYLIHMESVNIVARGFNNILELRKKYDENLLSSISELEKKTMINNILKNKDTLAENSNKNKWLNNILSRIKITKGQSWLEMGMPHTHADVIIFNENMFNNFCWSTFIHECVHIDQRLNWDKYLNLYNQWGFIKTNVSAIKGMESIINRNRLNPDAIDCNWIWKCPKDNNYYWIGAVFNSMIPEKLSDVSYIGLKLENRKYDNNIVNYYYNGSDNRNINNWKEFQEYFGIKNNNYHSNEIIAEYMGLYFNNSDINNEGYMIFKKWFNSMHI